MLQKPKIIFLISFLSVLALMVVGYIAFRESAKQAISPYISVKDIILRSEYSDIELKAKNKDEILNKLESLSFWKENGIYTFEYPKRLPKTAKILHISLVKNVDKPFLEQKTAEGNPVIAVGADVDTNGVAKINIALGEIILGKKAMEDGKWIDYGFWMAVYMLSSSDQLSTQGSLVQRAKTKLGEVEKSEGWFEIVY